jgi:hypothetical protein
MAKIAAVTGIDQSKFYVNHARARSTGPRITIAQADARVLPFACVVWACRGTVPH